MSALVGVCGGQTRVEQAAGSLTALDPCAEWVERLRPGQEGFQFEAAGTPMRVGLDDQCQLTVERWQDGEWQPHVGTVPGLAQGSELSGRIAKHAQQVLAIGNDVQSLEHSLQSLSDNSLNQPSRLSSLQIRAQAVKDDLHAGALPLARLNDRLRQLEKDVVDYEHHLDCFAKSMAFSGRLADSCPDWLADCLAQRSDRLEQQFTNEDKTPCSLRNVYQHAPQLAAYIGNRKTMDSWRFLQQLPPETELEHLSSTLTPALGETASACLDVELLRRKLVAFKELLTSPATPLDSLKHGVQKLETQWERMAYEKIRDMPQGELRQQALARAMADNMPLSRT